MGRFRTRILHVLVATATLVAVHATQVSAYEEHEVRDGGSLSGTITLDGAVPAPRRTIW